MREIFTELYKKVLGFFQAQEKGTESKTVAVNRMKLVLMQDRTNLTPLLLEKLRGEMIDVLSKYVEMDKDALELNFEQEGDQMALMLSIPVIRAKEEEEINALIEAEKKTKEESEKEMEEDTEISETKEEGQQEEDESIEYSEETSEKEEENETLETEEEEQEKEETEVEEKPSGKTKKRNKNEN